MITLSGGPCGGEEVPAAPDGTIINKDFGDPSGRLARYEIYTVDSEGTQQGLFVGLFPVGA